MSRTKETPQQKLIKIVHEIGLERVEEIISVIYLYDSQKDQPVFSSPGERRRGFLPKPKMSKNASRVTIEDDEKNSPPF